MRFQSSDERYDRVPVYNIHIIPVYPVFRKTSVHNTPLVQTSSTHANNYNCWIIQKHISASEYYELEIERCSEVS